MVVPDWKSLETQDQEAEMGPGKPILPGQSHPERSHTAQEVMLR